MLSAALYVTFPLIRQPQSSSEQTPYSTAAPDEIKGKIVTLKKLTEAHFFDYHNMFSNAVRQNLEFPSRITLDYTIRFLRYEMGREAEGTTLLYMIFDNQDDKLVGSIQIKEKNDHEPGQLACWLNEAYWGGGRLQEALALITKAYFKLHPEADDYIAHVRLWNKRSHNALKKFGLKEIGYFYENNQPARHILRYDRPQ